MGKAEDTLRFYVSELEKRYQSLLKILSAEADDIRKQDEKMLNTHCVLEKDSVDSIISLTKSIYIYIEKTAIDSDIEKGLKSINELKALAEKQISMNILNLNSSMHEIKRKIESIKLPKSARRVYYSGNNPTLMDIEI